MTCLTGMTVSCWTSSRASASPLLRTLCISFKSSCVVRRVDPANIDLAVLRAFIDLALALISIFFTNYAGLSDAP